MACIKKIGSDVLFDCANLGAIGGTGEIDEAIIINSSDIATVSEAPYPPNRVPHGSAPDTTAKAKRPEPGPCIIIQIRQLYSNNYTGVFHNIKFPGSATLKFRAGGRHHPPLPRWGLRKMLKGCLLF